MPDLTILLSAWGDCSGQDSLTMPTCRELTADRLGTRTHLGLEYHRLLNPVAA